VTRKGFWRRYDPIRFMMCGDEKLTCPGVRELIALKFTTDIIGILSTKVVISSTILIGTLNNDSLWVKNKI
jgi:hypothetical protein